MSRDLRVQELDFDPHWASEIQQPEEPDCAGVWGPQVAEMGITRRDQMICWNCKDLEHPFNECKLPQQAKFCFSCGLNGVIKAECTRCSGNERPSGNALANSRPNAKTLSQAPRSKEQTTVLRNPFNKPTNL